MQVPKDLIQLLKYLEELNKINPEAYENLWRKLNIEGEKEDLNERVANLLMQDSPLSRTLIAALPVHLRSLN